MSRMVYFSIHSILSRFAIPCLKLLHKEGDMPTATTRRRAQTAKRRGEAPSMHKTKKGTRGGQTRNQAAIGLSKARQDGVKVRRKNARPKRTHY